ncbi:T9SS type A sorting domain-containing protein [Rurimicrobium arvi]|uniref:Secretion system C-terminal sorting domain-containing protein n=1 Tax=Rurimicrobium arvi TaxID=2049916 RepID=A0ABP8MNL0_9BACT
MKPLILISSLLLSLSFFASAQTTQFAPVGAVWYHNAGNGVFRTTSVKDTVIGSVNCRRLEQKAMTDTALAKLGFGIYDQKPLFVYNNEDTVFIYNDFLGSFTPLYVFNVHPGDTVRFPAIQLYSYCGNDAQAAAADFSFVIDSVQYVDYGSGPLKTISSHSFKSTGGGASYSLGWHNYADSVNVYAATIGSVKTGLMPFCTGCGYVTDGKCDIMGGLRCYIYNAAHASVNLVGETCDKGIPPTSVSEYTAAENSLCIHPNPAGEQVTLGRLPQGKHTLMVYNALGQLCYLSDRDEGGAAAIDIQNWPSGTYFVIVSNGQSECLKGRFMKL